jgi:release factor glutamine methyltransferase
MIYEPREDSYLLQEAVKSRVKDRDFLDLGSGSGIQSETALIAGAKSVLAIDIQPDVITHLKKTYPDISVIKSDLFSKVEGKFNLIAFNPPYLPEDSEEDSVSAIATSGGKQGDELTLRFLEQATSHLAPGGKILIIVSSLSPHNRIEELISDLGLSKKILDSKKIFMETLECWEITTINKYPS